MLFFFLWGYVDPMNSLLLWQLADISQCWPVQTLRHGFDSCQRFYWTLTPNRPDNKPDTGVSYVIPKKPREQLQVKSVVPVHGTYRLHYAVLTGRHTNFLKRATFPNKEKKAAWLVVRRLINWSFKGESVFTKNLHLQFRINVWLTWMFISTWFITQKMNEGCTMIFYTKPTYTWWDDSITSIFGSAIIQVNEWRYGDKLWSYVTEGSEEAPVIGKTYQWSLIHLKFKTLQIYRYFISINTWYDETAFLVTNDFVLLCS